MLRQLLVGAGVSASTTVIHAIIMATVVRGAYAVVVRKIWWPWLHLAAVMTAAVFILMLAHVCEVMVWALVYGLLDAAPDGTDLVYFAFVNYTTLGYGDVTPVKRWLLLGPVTAMNGILMFGWSTAVIFQILRRTMVSTAPHLPLNTDTMEQMR
jgi:hypothetical protein